MNKTQEILTVAALVVFIAFGAFHYLKVKDFYHLTPTLGVPILGTSGPGPRNNVRRNNAVVHARRDLHRVVFLAAK